MYAPFGQLVNLIIDILSAIGTIVTIGSMIYYTHLGIEEGFKNAETEYQLDETLQWLLAASLVLSLSGAGLLQIAHYYGFFIPLAQIVMAAIGGGIAVFSTVQLIIWLIANM